MTDAQESEAARANRMAKKLAETNDLLKNGRHRIRTLEAELELSDATYRGTRETAAETMVLLHDAEQKNAVLHDQVERQTKQLDELTIYMDRAMILVDGLGARYEGEGKDAHWTLEVPGSNGRRLSMEFFIRQFESYRDRGKGWGAWHDEARRCYVYRVINGEGEFFDVCSGEYVEHTSSNSANRSRVLHPAEWNTLTGEDFEPGPFKIPVVTMEQKGNERSFYPTTVSSLTHGIAKDQTPTNELTPGDQVEPDCYVIIQNDKPAMYRAGDAVYNLTTKKTGRVLSLKQWMDHSGREWVDDPSQLPVAEYSDPGTAAKLTTWSAADFASAEAEDSEPDSD